MGVKGKGDRDEIDEGNPSSEMVRGLGRLSTCDPRKRDLVSGRGNTRDRPASGSMVGELVRSASCLWKMALAEASREGDTRFSKAHEFEFELLTLALLALLASLLPLPRLRDWAGFRSANEPNAAKVNSRRPKPSSSPKRSRF